LIFFFEKAIIVAIKIKINVDVDVVKKLPDNLNGKISDIKTKVNGTKIMLI
tara:strand:+ start:723 stop:875 length:153 start_codon:yes stop_codon:yes gene_type:complete